MSNYTLFSRSELELPGVFASELNSWSGAHLHWPFWRWSLPINFDPRPRAPIWKQSTAPCLCKL